MAQYWVEAAPFCGAGVAGSVLGMCDSDGEDSGRPLKRVRGGELVTASAVTPRMADMADVPTFEGADEGETPGTVTFPVHGKWYKSASKFRNHIVPVLCLPKANTRKPCRLLDVLSANFETVEKLKEVLKTDESTGPDLAAMDRAHSSVLEKLAGAEAAHRALLGGIFGTLRDAVGTAGGDASMTLYAEYTEMSNRHGGVDLKKEHDEILAAMFGSKHVMVDLKTKTGKWLKHWKKVRGCGVLGYHMQSETLGMGTGPGKEDRNKDRDAASVTFVHRDLMQVENLWAEFPQMGSAVGIGLREFDLADKRDREAVQDAVKGVLTLGDDVSGTVLLWMPMWTKGPLAAGKLLFEIVCGAVAQSTGKFTQGCHKHAITGMVTGPGTTFGLERVRKLVSMQVLISTRWVEEKESDTLKRAFLSTLPSTKTLLLEYCMGLGVSEEQAGKVAQDTIDACGENFDRCKLVISKMFEAAKAARAAERASGYGSALRRPVKSASKGGALKRTSKKGHVEESESDSNVSSDDSEIEPREPFRSPPSANPSKSFRKAGDGDVRASSPQADEQFAEIDEETAKLLEQLNDSQLRVHGIRRGDALGALPGFDWGVNPHERGSLRLDAGRSLAQVPSLTGRGKPGSDLPLRPPLPNKPWFVTPLPDEDLSADPQSEGVAAPSSSATALQSAAAAGGAGAGAGASAGTRPLSSSRGGGASAQLDIAAAYQSAFPRPGTSKGSKVATPIPPPPPPPLQPAGASSGSRPAGTSRQGGNAAPSSSVAVPPPAGAKPSGAGAPSGGGAVAVATTSTPGVFKMNETATPETSFFDDKETFAKFRTLVKQYIKKDGKEVNIEFSNKVQISELNAALKPHIDAAKKELEGVLDELRKKSKSLEGQAKKELESSIAHWEKSLNDVGHIVNITRDLNAAKLELSEDETPDGGEVA
jgi:hypothetical protein